MPRIQIHEEKQLFFVIFFIHSVDKTNTTWLPLKLLLTEYCAQWLLL
jgi:hypothetical protein